MSLKTLMKQRKALEEEINELKQLQDLACQKSPLTQRTKTVETELEMKYDLWRSSLESLGKSEENEYKRSFSPEIMKRTSNFKDFIIVVEDKTIIRRMKEDEWKVDPDYWRKRRAKYKYEENMEIYTTDEGEREIEEENNAIEILQKKGIA